MPLDHPLVEMVQTPQFSAHTFMLPSAPITVIPQIVLQSFLWVREVAYPYPKPFNWGPW